MSNYVLSRQTEIYISLICAGMDFEDAAAEARNQANYEMAKDNLKLMRCNLVEPVKEAFGLWKRMEMFY